MTTGAERLRIHVPGALPGERLRVRLAHLSVHLRGGEREAWAELLSVLAPSADRVAPLCPRHATCGGCTFMRLAYPAQLLCKRDAVVAELGRHAALAGIPVEACVASPLLVGYRNQAKYVYGRAHASGRLVLGAFAPRSHRLVDLAGCPVVEPVLDEVRRVLLETLAARNVEPFAEQRRTGILRYVVARANAAGKVMVTLVAARRGWTEASAIAADLVAGCPAVGSVLLNVNPTGGNRIFGDEEELLFGEPFLADQVGDVTVQLASRSFSQANRAVAARIYRDIVAAVPGRVRRAVDVYSGAAPIALALAPVADEVVAIEENAAATAAAAAGIARQGGAAGAVRVVTGDAAQCLAAIESAEIVVLDPPRKGCAEAVLAAVARLRPRLLAYLSCAPSTLARDLAILVAAGGRLVRITPYDLLPHTPHVETLALLAGLDRQPTVLERPAVRGEGREPQRRARPGRAPQTRRRRAGPSRTAPA